MTMTARGMRHPEAQFTFASRAAFLSSVVAALGVLFLVVMYLGFLIPAKALLVFGSLNDLCVLAQYALALPVVVALDEVLAPLSAWHRRVILVIGLLGCLGAVCFQALLLLGVMSFRQQVGFASLSVLLAGLWAVLATLGVRRLRPFPASTALLVATGLYFGYPLWSLRVSRVLRGDGTSSPAT